MSVPSGYAIREQKALSMKHLTPLLALLLLVGSLHAQVTDFDEWKKAQQDKYNNFVNQQQQRFAAFRDSINAAYAEKMQQNWEKFPAGMR